MVAGDEDEMRSRDRHTPTGNIGVQQCRNVFCE